ncbi:MAG: LamG-like jellyroll fold domain-containing protein, partial [Candidatus Binatia bacterium]
LWYPGDGNGLDIQGVAGGTGQPAGARNGAGFAAGMVGQAFSLNGTNQFFSAPAAPNQYPGAGPFTLDAWIQTTVPNRIVVGKNECPGSSCPAGTSSWYQLFVDANGRAAVFIREGGLTLSGDPNSGAGGLTLAGTRVLTDGAVHHVAAIRDVAVGELRLYVDGILEAHTPLTSGADGAIQDDDGQPDELTIGAVCHRSGSGCFPVAFFSGQIDEVQMFHRALSAAEIRAIFDAGSAGQCKEGVGTSGCTEGTSCTTDFPGICSSGHTTCPNGFNGAPVCEAERAPVQEICDSGTDDDCDGEVDEAGCRTDSPPTAVDDAYDARVGESLSIPAAGVLANDTDPESQPLGARLAAGPEAGDVTLNADGSFEYAPRPLGTGSSHEGLELTQLQRPTIRASSEGLPAANLLDGTLVNQWAPTTATFDPSPFVEFTFEPAVAVREIRYFGARSAFANFATVAANLYDSSGNLVFATGDLPVPPKPTPDFVIDVEEDAGRPVAGVSRVRFDFAGKTGTENNRAVAEIEIYGDSVGLAPVPPVTNLAQLFATRASASSFFPFFDERNRPEGANDDHPVTSWYAATHGAGEFYEVAFPVDVDVTSFEAANPGIRHDGGIETASIDCFGRFE